MSSQSVTRPPTAEELEEQKRLLKTTIPVREPGGNVAPVPEEKVAPTADELLQEFNSTPEAMEEETVETAMPLPEQKPSRDWQAELNAARARADEMRSWSNVIKGAEGINAAFVGKTPDNTWSKELSSQAALPEARVNEDKALYDSLEKDRLKQDDTDPFSPGNVAFREMIKVEYPQLARSPNFSRMTRPALEKLLGIKQRGDRIATTNKGIETRNKFGEKKLGVEQDQFEKTHGLKTKQYEETVTHNRNTEGIGLINASRKSEASSVNPATGRSAADTRLLPKHLQGLSKATGPFAEADAALRGIEALVPGITDGKLPKDYPVTPGDKARIMALGGAAVDQSKKQQEAIVKATKDFAKIVAQIRSGLTVTDQERAFYEQQFGDRVFSDPIVLANALIWYKGLMYKKLATAQQGFERTGNPDIDKFQVLDDWENIPGSISYRDPFYRSVGGLGNRRAPGSIAAQPPPVSDPNTPEVQGTAPGGNAGSPEVTVTNKQSGKTITMSREKAEKYRADPANFEVSP